MSESRSPAQKAVGTGICLFAGASPLLLALDPSSTRTGFAVFRGRELIDAGYFKPAAGAESEQRIDAMVGDLLRLLNKLGPEDFTVVIEVPSGKPGTGLKRGAGAHLAVYGVAVGELRRAAKVWSENTYAKAFDLVKRQTAIISVTERAWTRGTPKRVRQRRTALLHPRYAAVLAKDSGGDVADAIGLGEWYLGFGPQVTQLRRLKRVGQA